MWNGQGPALQKRAVPREQDAEDPSATPAANHPATPPRHALAGHFDLLGELGSGSSGTVHKARLREDYEGVLAGTEVAIKFLRQDRLDDPKARQRFLDEGELGRRLRHPNVAAIHGVEHIDVLGLESIYLVMELVSGTTLRAFMQDTGRPVEDLTRRIGADAAQGLYALHRQGIVHRDVKPENLVLTPDGQVKIVDLGLARPFGEHGTGSASSGGGIAGSVAYAAPEVLRGQPTSERSDLYALGVVLFEVVTGQHPFADCKLADDMIHAHLFRAPARPSHLRPRVSPLLEQVILDLLHKEPDQRPASAADVVRRLQQGERSDWWRRHLAAAPALASRRRLRQMRRHAETGFFDREREQKQLDAWLIAARGGKGKVVCLSGPHGVGRRRLLDEAMSRWIEAQQDLLYLGGDADSELGHGEPFASTLLDWLLRGEDRNSPQAVKRAAHRAHADLQFAEADANALAAIAAGQSQELPEVRADRLASALLQLASQDRTLVLRVEHAERLDTSGRLVLGRLLAAAASHRLLVLVVAGPDGLPWLGAERLELAGLDEASFAAFGRALCRDGQLGADFLAAAHAALAGNPGNLLETLIHLVQEGQLHGRPGDYHDLASDAEPRPAPPLLARFAARVQGLSPEQQRILEAAAVLGDRCAHQDLAALSGYPELRVLETLSLFRGRVIAGQGGEVAFRHRDFRLSLLRSMQEPRRIELHRAAAALLAARGAAALEVGLHRSRGLDHEGCLEPLLQGLEELVRSGSRRTSQRIAARLKLHFDQLAPTPSIEPLRLRFLLLHAEVREALGQRDQATALFRAADTLARHLGDLPSLGASMTGLAAVAYAGGRLLAAVNLLEHSHQLLADQDGERGRSLAAKAHGLHGRILLYLGQSEDGLRHLQQALRLLPASDVDLWCHLQIDLARMEALRHHYSAAQKTLQKVDRELQRRLRPRVQLRLHLYRGQIRGNLGDDGASDDLHKAIEAAERLSLPGYAARGLLFLGERARRLGRTAPAVAHMLSAKAMAESAGDRLGATLAAIHLRELGQHHDDLAAVVEELELPELQAAWYLAETSDAGRRGDDAARQQRLELALLLTEVADLPLMLHLRILHLSGHEPRARNLLRAIQDRIPDRRGRRRFRGEWHRHGGF